MKMTYLYNELAALRAAAEPAAVIGGYSVPIELAPDAAATSAQTRAMTRKHEAVSVFAICPQQPLSINTSEFWKPAEAAEAFQLMYKTTRTALDENFEQLTDPNWIMMTLVAPQGGRTVIDEF
jgi:hypothetical protein